MTAAPSISRSGPPLPRIALAGPRGDGRSNGGFAGLKIDTHGRKREIRVAGCRR